MQIHNKMRFRNEGKSFGLSSHPICHALSLINRELPPNAKLLSKMSRLKSYLKIKSPNYFISTREEISRSKVHLKELANELMTSILKLECFFSSIWQLKNCSRWWLKNWKFVNPSCLIRRREPRGKHDLKANTKKNFRKFNTFHFFLICFYKLGFFSF